MVVCGGVSNGCVWWQGCWRFCVWFGWRWGWGWWQGYVVVLVVVEVVCMVVLVVLVGGGEVPARGFATPTHDPAPPRLPIHSAPARASAPPWPRGSGVRATDEDSLSPYSKPPGSQADDGLVALRRRRETGRTPTHRNEAEKREMRSVEVRPGRQWEGRWGRSCHWAWHLSSLSIPSPGAGRTISRRWAYHVSRLSILNGNLGPPLCNPKCHFAMNPH